MTSLTPSARQNFAACIVMLVLTSVCLILRGAVRLSLRQAPLAADWLSLLAFLLFCAYCGVMINCKFLSYVRPCLELTTTDIFNVSMFRAFEPNFAFGLVELANLLKVCYRYDVFYWSSSSLVTRLPMRLRLSWDVSSHQPSSASSGSTIPSSQSTPRSG
jgi:hypothetical protein